MPGAQSPPRLSADATVLKQRASVVPRNSFFVSVDDLEGKPDRAGISYARTNEESAINSSRPIERWGDTGQRGRPVRLLHRRLAPFLNLPLVKPFSGSSTPERIQRRLLHSHDCCRSVDGIGDLPNECSRQRKSGSKSAVRRHHIIALDGRTNQVDSRRCPLHIDILCFTT